MRNQLLAGVAIAALSLTVAGAMAQERNPAAGAPGASSAQAPSSSGERGGAAAGRSEDRSAQGQRASEGAGRDGATRNASERGQERSAQGRDNNDQKSSPTSAQSGAPSGDRDQKGGAASSSATSAQRGAADQKPDAGERSSNTSASGANERSGQPSSSSASSNERDSDRNRAPSTSTQNAPSQSNPREGAVQNNNQNPSASSSSSSTNANTSTSSTRTGADQNRAAASGGQTSTNVQVRGEFNIDQPSATRVHDRLIRESGARETDVNIRVDLGGRIPDRVRLRPVPADIVEISPRYRNYEYTIVHDEIVIVEPKTKKIVQVISSGGNGGARKSAHMVRLDTKQRDLVKRDVLKTRTGAVNRQDLNIDLRQGLEVPDRVTLQTFPEEVWRDAPELREVRYFIVQDEVVLVDPDTREVIEILR